MSVRTMRTTTVTMGVIAIAVMLVGLQVQVVAGQLEGSAFFRLTANLVPLPKVGALPDTDYYGMMNVKITDGTGSVVTSNAYLQPAPFSDMPKMFVTVRSGIAIYATMVTPTSATDKEYKSLAVLIPLKHSTENNATGVKVIEASGGWIILPGKTLFNATGKMTLTGKPETSILVVEGGQVPLSLHASILDEVRQELIRSGAITVHS